MILLARSVWERSAMTGAQEAADPLIAGRYRLLRRLGTGGMGRVWLAYDQGLACEVALKEVVLPPDLPEREVGARVARARSEAQHAARLRNHPNVVTVYDIVEEGGLPWIVMEFIPGAMDLEAVVREQGPLPPAQVALIGLAVLDALLEGHRLGILHRDVKPANILLTHYESHLPHPPEDGQVLLTDYGIALEPNSEETRLTATVEILGTPRYMAPERVRNEAPTPASDLFSLGATLYFAVEGTGPFDRATAVTTLSALLFEPATLSLRAAELTPVLLGLLAKEPADRSDGAEAVQQLTAIAAQPHPSSSQQPALPPKMPPPERARPPASKPPRAEESAPPTKIPSQPERGEPTSTPLGALPHKNEGDEARLPPHPPRSRHRRARLVAGAALVALVAGGGGIYVTQCRSPSPELRASTSVLSMPVDKSPQGVAASPNGRRVYVTSYSSGSVSVIDPNTDRTVGKPRAQVMLFTTGRGSVVGSALSPVVKVCANPDTYRRRSEDMDIDPGRILAGEASLDEVGDEIVEVIARTVHGEPTKSEALGHQEFQLGYKSFEPSGPARLPV
ncbi:protein kinase [Streptomyces sp. NPDC059904]|uniref:protein kinase domain-containing protein n=1 Tax=Streptomyces sp. NPDC059904 TaxID=3346996 RepID=UPI003655423B